MTSVRARRRDLAVLKTLGCSRRQVGATVAWQATTIVGLALVIGIPVGIIAGRWTWRGFAEVQWVANQLNRLVVDAASAASS